MDDSRLIFVALNVDDLDRSVAFYSDAFGIDIDTAHERARYRDPDGNLVSITQQT